MHVAYGLHWVYILNLIFLYLYNLYKTYKKIKWIQFVTLVFEVSYYIIVLYFVYLIYFMLPWSIWAGWGRNWFPFSLELLLSTRRLQFQTVARGGLAWEFEWRWLKSQNASRMLMILRRWIYCTVFYCCSSLFNLIIWECQQCTWNIYDIRTYLENII